MLPKNVNGISRIHKNSFVKHRMKGKPLQLKKDKLALLSDDLGHATLFRRFLKVISITRASGVRLSFDDNLDILHGGSTTSIEWC